MGVAGQPHAPAHLPPGNTRYPLYRGLGGPPGRSGRMRKISPSPPVFDPRTFQPVTSRCTDWAIPAPIGKILCCIWHRIFLLNPYFYFAEHHFGQSGPILKWYLLLWNYTVQSNTAVFVRKKILFFDRPCGSVLMGFIGLCIRICKKRSLSNVSFIFCVGSCPHRSVYSSLTFRHRASCVLGQAFHYSPENAVYIFNQQIYFIIWYLLDRASFI